MPAHITTSILVPDEELDYITIAAIEGGTGYWATVLAYSHDGPVWATIAENEEVEGDDDSSNWRTWKIDSALIAVGMQLWAEGWPERFARYIENDFDHDANDADDIVQLGVFGKLVYA